MRRSQHAIALVLATLTSSVAVQRAGAHAVGAECKLNGNRVELEAFYDDDTPTANAKVRVEDEAKKRVADGVTDARGRWSFARPAPGKYTVVVDAGAGHQAKLTLTVPAEATPQAPTAAMVAECDCCTESGDSSSGTAIRLDDGPSRAEFTAFPWLKLGIGLAVIGVLAAGFLIARRMS